MDNSLIEIYDDGTWKEKIQTKDRTKAHDPKGGAADDVASLKRRIEVRFPPIESKCSTKHVLINITDNESTWEPCYLQIPRDTPDINILVPQNSDITIEVYHNDTNDTVISKHAIDFKLSTIFNHSQHESSSILLRFLEDVTVFNKKIVAETKVAKPNLEAAKPEVRTDTKPPEELKQLGESKSKES